MSGVNLVRWILGGVVAGMVMFVLEGLASVLYQEEMMAAMAEAGLSMTMSPAGFAQAVVVSLLVGLVAVFFYAASRPRFGPGPRTAILVAVAFFAGGYVPSLIGFNMMGLFPVSLLVQWGVIGLVELILATLAGAWIYREAEG